MAAAKKSLSDLIALDAQTNRRTAYYANAIALAKEIIRNSDRHLAEGDSRSWTFLMRTPEAIEAGVRAVLKEQLPGRVTKRGIQLKPSYHTLNPDLVFDDGTAIGDVKYKLGSNDWVRSDLFQVVTFATGFGAARAAIVSFDRDSHSSPPDLQIGGVNLRTSPGMRAIKLHRKNPPASYPRTSVHGFEQSELMNNSGVATSTPDREPFRLFGRDPAGEQPIVSLEDWFAYASPKGGEKPRRPLRSAYQLAEAWCTRDAPAAPLPFLAVLHAHHMLEDVQLLRRSAEHKTALRGERGGPRVHDLLLEGRCSRGTVVLGIEGKADERFDRPLSARWRQATDGKSPSNWPARLARLVPALLGMETTLDGKTLNPAIGDIPYQLLSALAGTLIEAEERGAALAVFVVHVFISRATLPERVEANRAAFAAFAAQLSGTCSSDIEDGEFYGPFTIPGAEESRIPDTIPVLLGEIATEVVTEAGSSWP